MKKKDRCSVCSLTDKQLMNMCKNLFKDVEQVLVLMYQIGREVERRPSLIPPKK
jgi:hypothetical protein